MLTTTGCVKQIWLLPAKKMAQAGPEMAPKSGPQIGAPNWVTLCFQKRNPQSRAHFRCPEYSCFFGTCVSSKNAAVNSHKNKIFCLDCLDQEAKTPSICVACQTDLWLASKTKQSCSVHVRSFSHCGGHVMRPTFLVFF